MGIRNFNVRGSQVTERRRIGLNQSLTYTNPSPPLPPQIFYLPLFHSVAKRKLFLGTKDIGERRISPPSYAYGCRMFGDTVLRSGCFRKGLHNLMSFALKKNI
jgi:hypothetical protein